MKQYILLFFALAAAYPLYSQNEIIFDSTFNQDGRVTFLNPAKKEKGLLLQPDGKMVLFGDSGLDIFFEHANLTLARINADGNLDPAFNTTGSLTMPTVHNWYFSAASGLLQPDGKIVVAGNGSLPDVYQQKALLYRFLENGNLDSNFGASGKMVLELDSLDLYLKDIKLLADSKLLVLVNGTYSGPGTYIDKPLLFRLLPDGSPDPSFGNNGVLDISNAGMTTPYALAFSPEDKIYVVGVDTLLANRKSMIIRLHPDGSIDNGFYFKLPLQGALSDGFISTLEVQPDGKILAGGNHSLYALLLRLLPDGTLDPSFSRDGITINAFNSSTSLVSKMITKPDGKILIHGGGLQCAQFNANGSLDYNFDLDGKFNKVPTADPNVFAEAHGVVLMPDGKILIGATLSNRFFVARFVNRLDQ